MFLITAPVETPATRASIDELVREMQEIRTTRPLDATELADSQGRLVQGFPQQFQTLRGVAGGLGDILLNDRPLDEWATFADRVSALGLEDLAAVTARGLDPDRVVWVLVGDWAVLQDQLAGLGLGEIEVVREG
jgi:zinc protease